MDTKSKVGDWSKAPAFPPSEGPVDVGMSYRQWLYGQALIGALAHSNKVNPNAEETAETAMECAEALMERMSGLFER